MPRPRYCENPGCQFAIQPPRKWLHRNGFYRTATHGVVQRYRCLGCGRGMSDQTRSIHYYAKRRVDLKLVFIRLRGGSSMRDIARELGCSRSAISSAVLRLGRQAMGSHASLVADHTSSGQVCFDGLVSSVTGADYQAQITTLADRRSELLLAMSHCVTERGGVRTPKQRHRIERRRTVWSPTLGALRSSIQEVVSELVQFAPRGRVCIDTDKHPIYRRVIGTDLALRWYRMHSMLRVRTTRSTAPRTSTNPLFVMNYIDRMIRHRMAEHTRETIAVARNATMQMHRMWIFAWDHNCRQPKRVASRDDRCRALHAGVTPGILSPLLRRFFTTRIDMRHSPMPRSMRRVWSARLDTPPVRWKAGQVHTGPRIPAYAMRDLHRSFPQGP